MRKGLKKNFPHSLINICRLAYIQEPAFVKAIGRNSYEMVLQPKTINEMLKIQSRIPADQEKHFGVIKGWGLWFLLLSQQTRASGIRTAAKTRASWPFVPSPGNKKTGMCFLQTETGAVS
jgi:hypothetical protein